MALWSPCATWLPTTLEFAPLAIWLPTELRSAPDTVTGPDAGVHTVTLVPPSVACCGL